VKNLELRELIKKEKMYIYIEGKEPVARKSKSLAEMGVKDGDNLIVTTEMKLPLHEYSDDDDLDDPAGMFPGVNCDDGFDNDDAPNHMDLNKHGLPSPRGYEISMNQVPGLPMENHSHNLHHDPRTTLPQISSSMDMLGGKKLHEQEKSGHAIGMAG
jgi:hypothetical protein